MYDFWNPNDHSIQCTLGGKIGIFTVRGKECVPSATDEARGITSEVLLPFVSKSCLHRTPAPDRRRIMESVGVDVPEQLVQATCHLDEFKNENKSKRKQITKSKRDDGSDASHVDRVSKAESDDLIVEKDLFPRVKTGK